MRYRLLTVISILAALLCLSALVSCSRPEDENWIQITSFSIDDVAISTLSSSLAAGEEGLSDDVIDMGVTNFSTNAQGNTPGTGITIERIRVNYLFGDYTANLPSYDYAVRFYLPSDEGNAGEEVILNGITIVPVSLKQWLLNPSNVPAQITCCRFTMQAEITVFGRTAEGSELSTGGGLTIVFN